MKDVESYKEGKKLKKEEEEEGKRKVRGGQRTGEGSGLGLARDLPPERRQGPMRHLFLMRDISGLLVHLKLMSLPRRGHRLDGFVGES